MSERHRLTITISESLYRELCDLAGSRRISRWIEEAAWARIRSLHPEQPAPATAGLTDDPDPAPPQTGGLPPNWCWSPLRDWVSSEPGDA